MDKEIKNYFSIKISDNVVSISNRIPLDWKEIVAFSISLLIIFSLLINPIVGISIGLIGSVFYTFFRFAAWIYYEEVILDTQLKTLAINNFRFNKLINSDVVDSNMDCQNFTLIPIERSGKTKFLWSYENHKIAELMIFKNWEDAEVVRKTMRDICS